MILKNLYIIAMDDGHILKKYTFNETGINIILGEKRENNEETNGVGKSTMIDCLSFLLGKTIPSYYSNNEVLLNKNIFIILEVKANDNKLFVGRSFNSPRNGYILESEQLLLTIDDWKKVSLSKFKAYIEELVLEDTHENISFAALREYIIRDEKTGFNNILLPNRSAVNQYMLLNYLFTLPHLTEIEIKSLKNNIDNMNNEIKFIESVNLNISDLKVRKDEILNEIKELDQMIDQAKTTKQYNTNTKEYTIIKKELNEVQDKIFEYEHICDQYQKNIDNLHEKVNEIKQLEDVETFYTDLVGLFPDNVKENYTKVKQFYDFMVESRGNYFKDKIASLNLELKKLYTKKHDLEKELDISSKIFKSDTFIEDISIVMDEKRRKEIELAEIEVRINDYNKKNDIVDQINDIQHEILRINSMKYDEFLSFENTKNQLQAIFNELMAITYNQHGFLDFEYDNRISYSNNSTTGRVKISCSIPDERSHGRLHMKINMFDLTWFLFRNSRKLNINFLIHDGSYSNPDPYVKGVLLQFLDKKLKEKEKGQYFVTVNKTELLKEDLKNMEDIGFVVAKLDRMDNDNNRFFGFKF